MLDGKNQPAFISGLDKTLQSEIKLFLQGAVHAWVKIHNKGDQFSFNTLMSDAYDDCWQQTPLIKLYHLYNTGVQTPTGTVNPAMKTAAQKGGGLLMCVLREDTRNFKTVSNNPNVYTII